MCDIKKREFKSATQIKDANNEDQIYKVMTWGYEAPVKEDYTKDNASISNKIRKMGRQYISEAHDNFRPPERTEAGELLFDYFDREQMEKFEKMFIQICTEKENQGVNQSAYEQTFGKSQLCQHNRRFRSKSPPQ